MEYWLIILVALLLLGYAMSFRVTTMRSLRSFPDNVHIDNIKTQDVAMKDNNTIVEKFGGGGDWDLVSTGMNTVLLKTNDGGATWSNQEAPWIRNGTYWGNIYNSVFFPENDIGYIVGEGIVLKTVNGGGTVSIDEKESVKIQNTLKIYPNPASYQITIETNDITVKGANLTIYSTIGHKILEYNITERKTSLNISSWPKGIYIVQINKGNTNETGKIIKY